MTNEEKAYQNAVAELGCIACMLDGRLNNYVSIHHVDGRTKPGAHMKILALCFPHHQGGTKFEPSVHPWKRAFEKKYGSQETLMQMTGEAVKNGGWPTNK